MVTAPLPLLQLRLTSPSSTLVAVATMRTRATGTVTLTKPILLPLRLPHRDARTDMPDMPRISTRRSVPL